MTNKKPSLLRINLVFLLPLQNAGLSPAFFMLILVDRIHKCIIIYKCTILYNIKKMRLFYMRNDAKTKAVWAGVGALGMTALAVVPVIGDAISSVIVKIRSMIGGK